MEVLPPEGSARTKDTQLETKSISLNAQTPEIIQALYHEITNKTEKIQDIFEDSLNVSHDNLCELNRFIEQSFKPLEVKKPNIRVRVSYDGGENLQFSSFERFSITQTSTTKPIKSLKIKYSFLVSTPVQRNEKELQNEYSSYDVEISLIPTIYKDKDYDGMPMGLKRLLITSMPTMVSEITYVDFAVARTFQAAIKSWVETVKVPNQSAATRHLKKHSTSYFKGLKAIAIVLSFAVLYWTIPNYNVDNSIAFQKFSLWLLAGCGLILAISSLVKVFERLHDMFVAPMNKYCVVNITSGDKLNTEKIVKAYKETPRKIFQTLGAAVFAISLNLIAAYIFTNML